MNNRYRKTSATPATGRHPRYIPTKSVRSRLGTKRGMAVHHGSRLSRKVPTTTCSVHVLACNNAGSEPGHTLVSLARFSFQAQPAIPLGGYHEKARLLTLLELVASASVACPLALRMVRGSMGESQGKNSPQRLFSASSRIKSIVGLACTWSPEAFAGLLRRSQAR